MRIKLIETPGAIDINVVEVHDKDREASTYMGDTVPIPGIEGKYFIVGFYDILDQKKRTPSYTIDDKSKIIVLLDRRSIWAGPYTISVTKDVFPYDARKLKECIIAWFKHFNPEMTVIVIIEGEPVIPELYNEPEKGNGRIW